MLSTKVCVNCKILKYWIEKKKKKIDVNKKNQFSGAQLDPKTYKKNQNCSSKKNVWSVKIEHIGF